MPLGLVQRHCLLLRRPVAIVPFLEDVLVPCSICIFALNGIFFFCFDRQGKAKQSHSKKAKQSLLSAHHCALPASPCDAAAL